jgi:guanylate kinase
MKSGKVFVISGPSGVGKTTILNELFKDESFIQDNHIVKCMTATTRLPREGEMHGRHYLFFTREDFEKKIRYAYFLEHAEYNNNLYGTPHSL